MASNYKQKIYQLVQNSKTAEAINVGIQASNKLTPSSTSNWTLLKNRHDKVNRNERLGIISFSEAAQEQNKITLAVLEMSSDFDKEHHSQPELQSNDKILFLASNPQDTARLRLEKEFTTLSHNLQDGNFSFQLSSEFAVTPDKLQKVILRQKPRILHFSGHGTSPNHAPKADGYRVLSPRIANATGGIILQDHTGKSKEVDSQALEELFAIFVEFFALEVVVLNACYSAAQAKAINKHVPYVVGMNTAIQDQDAIHFTSSFYMALAEENNVKLAFRLACNQIRLNGNSDENIPILLIKESKN